MLTIWKRVFITCLGFVAVMPHLAQPQVSFPEVMQVLRGGAPAQRSAPPSADVGSKTLAVEEKQVSYSFTPSGLVRFSFDEKDYRNTYMLDCKQRQFRWVENFRLSTEEVTDNNAGAEWKPLTPNSTISNAVHEVACPQDLAGKGGNGGNEAGTNAQEPSFDCSQAKSWSEKTVCNNPTAAALDLQVSRLYNTARAQATDTRKVELKKAQLEWLRTRETCEQSSDTTECLLNVYHDRIAELGSVAPTAGEVSTAIADGYTVPKLATITLATDTREEGGLDSFLGIWEYSDPNSKEDPRYFKVLRVDAHQFRLIEGYKNWYVNDKDKIRWFDRSQDTFEPEPPTIYLQPSEGKLVGQFVSGSFRPTHGIDYTYRLTLEKMSPNTLRYSVWMSQDEQDGSAETFEATKITGAIEISAPNTAENGAIVPVTVSVLHENLRDIAVYSGDLSRMAIKAVLTPLASPRLSTRIKMPHTGPVIVVATTIDGHELTAEKQVVVIGGKGVPSDEMGSVLDENAIKMAGRNDEVKMLVTAAMSTRSHVSSVRVSTGDALLADVVVTPWASNNPYFVFKSVRDVGGQFEVQLELNTGERAKASIGGASGATQVASTGKPLEPAEHSERIGQSTTHENAGEEMAKASARTTRVSVKDGSVLAGAITAGEVGFKSSFGKIKIQLDNVVEFSAGKLRLADGTILTGEFVDGEAEVATIGGKVAVDAREIISIAREAQHAPDTMVSKEQPSKEGPSRLEIESHLLQAAGASYSIEGLQYEIYPTYDANAGRISCTGLIVLNEPLYKPDSNGHMVTVSHDAGIRPRDWGIYGHHIFYFFVLSHEAGLRLPFRCDLVYQKQVDRWFIQGKPQFAQPSGRPKMDLPNKSFIVGSSEYNQYVESLKERKKTVDAMENNFKQEIEKFFAPGNMRTMTHRCSEKKAIWEAMLVIEESEPWRIPRVADPDEKLLIIHGKAVLKSGKYDKWKIGQEVPVEIEVLINQRTESTWSAEAKGVIFVVRDSNVFKKDEIRMSGSDWNGTIFEGRSCSSPTIE